MGLALRSAHEAAQAPALRSGRMVVARRTFVAHMVGLVLAVLLVMSMPAGALAAGGQQPSLQLAGPDSIELARIDIMALPVQATPLSIETGVPCGMDEMCGLDPCLCGAADQWGACACNGTRETHPVLSFSPVQDGVVGAVELFGTTYLVALGAGSTDATVHAELLHYEAADLSMQVSVAPFGFVDLLKIIGVLLVVAGLCTAVFFGVRGLIRVLARLAHRVCVRAPKAVSDSGEEDTPDGDSGSAILPREEEPNKKGK